jgi:hypothetical protein
VHHGIGQSVGPVGRLTPTGGSAEMSCRVEKWTKMELFRLASRGKNGGVPLPLIGHKMTTRYKMTERSFAVPA